MKHKLYFILVVLLFTFITIFTINLFRPDVSPIQGAVVQYEYLSIKREIQLSLVHEPSVIIRIDDIQNYANIDAQKKLLDIARVQQVPISAGIIPSRIGKNSEWSLELISRIQTGEVEPVLHGWGHSENEFKELNYSTATELIQNGIDVFEKNLHVRPDVFIPPQNEYNNEVVRALDDLDFVVLSARDELKLTGDIYFIGRNAEVIDYDAGNKYLDYRETLRQCNEAIQMLNVCVIGLHPQDYTNIDTGEIIPERIKDFEQIISELKKEKVNFITFSELITS